MKKNTQKIESSSEDSPWEDIEDPAHDFEGESVNLSVKSVKSKPGRKKIAEQWTRVICIGKDDLMNIRNFALGPDLLLGNAMQATVSRGKQVKKWKPLFWPDHYVKEGHSLKLMDKQLTE